jgi:hypothetical protein
MKQKQRVWLQLLHHDWRLQLSGSQALVMLAPLKLAGWQKQLLHQQLHLMLCQNHQTL